MKEIQEEKEMARTPIIAGWGVVNAMADFVSHHSIIRNTENAKERRWGDIMTGSKILDQTKDLDKFGDCHFEERRICNGRASTCRDDLRGC